MKNFTRVLIAASFLVTAALNSYSQDVFKTANVGIGTTTPAQKLEIGGTNNTLRIDGLIGGGLYNVAPSASTANFVYVNSSGDLYSMPNGASGSVLTINSSGIPTWTAASTLANAWSLTGNAISATFGTNYIGTSAASEPIVFKVNNTYSGMIDGNLANVYFGQATGGDSTVYNTGASQNVAIGWEAFASLPSTTTVNGVNAIGYDALHNNRSSNVNAVGAYALYNNTTGSPNEAFGYGAAFNVTTASNNIALGYEAEYYNQTGFYNTAVGDSALYGTALYYGYYNTGVGVNALGALDGTASTNGAYNTAVGYESLRHLKTGNNNTAFGYQASYNNITGYGNTAVGYQALFKNTYSGNTAIGTNALYNNNIGSVANGPNTAIGDSAMYANTTGVKNVAIGFGALASPTVSNYNTAVGYEAMMPTLATGTVADNVDIGWLAGQLYTSQSNNVAVGAGAMEGTAAFAAANPSQDVAIGAYALANAGTGANYDIAIGSGTTSTTGPLGSSTFTGSNDIAIGFEAGNYTTGTPLTTGSSNINIGYGSYATVATVSSNIAIGYISHFGGTASANDYNTAIGYNTAATGTSGSTAIGYQATASGAGSTALGYLTSVSGTDATGIGYDITSVAGTNATAIGYTAAAAGGSATAIGPSSNASTTNATAIGPSTTANTANTVIIGSTGTPLKVGIGTTTPAQSIEVAGAGNTIRIDGLATGGTFNTQLTTTSNIVYTLASSGDLYSLPNTGASAGYVLTLNANGAPAWAASSAIPTANSPLLVTGSNLSLPGPTGSILVGNGTGSQFLAAGPVGDVLVGNGTGMLPSWTTITALAGSGDNWGTQVAITDSSNEIVPGTPENTITGDGLSTSPLRLARQGASNNQVLAWNTAGNTWLPATPSSLLTTNNILGGTAVVITNPNNQVVGGSNVTIDVQGTAGGVLYGKGIGTSAAFTGAGTSGQVLISSGAGAPTWTTLSPANGWSTSGNAGTIPGTNYLGTTTAAGLDFEINGANAGAIDPQMPSSSAANVYLGAASTSSPVLNGAGNNDAGDNNVAIGLSALASAGGSSYVGGNTGASNGYISSNVAVGVYALSSAVYGGQNVALGAWSQRLFNYPTANTSTGNTSAGAYSLYSNSTGKFNTANGYYSMYGRRQRNSDGQL